MILKKKWSQFQFSSTHIIMASVVLHVLAAIFGKGFFHFDEHFQILEFANLKLGNILEQDLPWEYHEKMRPWLIPSVVFFTKSIFNAIGLTSPFVFAFILRLACSLFGLYAFWKFYLSFKDEIKKKSLHLPLLFFSTSSWFYFIIQPRYSSEAIGASLFALTLTRVKSNDIFWAGLLAGVSFWCRFHLGISILFLFTWMIYQRVQVKTLFLFCVAFLLVSIPIIAIDYWGYGSFQLTPLNYVKQNLFYDKVSGFGINPWYDYIKFIFNKSFPLFGIVIILGYILFIVKKPLHLLTFVTLPYLIIHNLIGHKELRFLFPLVFTIPFIIFMMIEYFSPRLKKLKTYGKFLLVLNMIFAIFASFSSLHPAESFYQKLYRDNIKIDQMLILGDLNPFYVAQLKTPFMHQQSPAIKFEDKGSSLDSFENQEVYVFGNRAKHFLRMKKEEGCEMIYVSYPKWIAENILGRFSNKSKMWSMYLCKK